MPRISQILFVLIVLAFLVIPGKAVFAHGEPYYDLNPDRYFTKPLNLASTTATVALLFQPQNDFLSSFDFWFDNSGDAGNVTFRVKNSNGTLLASRTISVSHITKVLGGKRTHVDLTSQIPVSNTQVYNVEIQSSMPNLQIYYVNRIEIVGYQVTITSPYLIGVNKIGNTEEVYTFKYALYEVDENGAPVIYATSTQNLSPTRTKIFWRANEPMDYRVEFGTKASGIVFASTTYNGSMTSCGEGEELCSMSLIVTSGTEYFYNLFTKDEWGNEGIYSDTFTSEVDLTPSPSPPASSPFVSEAPIPSYLPPWMQYATPSASPQGSPLPQSSVSPEAKYMNAPNSVSVVWTEDEKAENYEVKITGKNTGYVGLKIITKGQTQTVFQGVPSDTYTVEIYAEKFGEKVIVQEEVTTTATGSKVNLYLIIGGILIIILIALAIVYNKYKEFI